MKRFSWVDLVMPGASLTVAGRLGWGLPLLVLAVLNAALLLAALLLAAVLGGGFLAAWAWPRCATVHLLLAGAALILRWRAARRAPDPARLRALARAASAAWLRGEAVAATRARELVRAAPDEPQAWQLHALITGERRSLARAEALRRRPAE